MIMMLIDVMGMAIQLQMLCKLDVCVCVSVNLCVSVCVSAEILNGYEENTGCK